MNWLKYQWHKFWVNPYRWLYSKIGGRPWTFISRDIYHQLEYVVLMGLLILGYKCHLWFSTREFFIILTAGTIFFIWGHFFWGKEYIPNQPAPPLTDKEKPYYE